MHKVNVGHSVRQLSRHVHHCVTPTACVRRPAVSKSQSAPRSTHRPRPLTRSIIQGTLLTDASSARCGAALFASAASRLPAVCAKLDPCAPIVDALLAPLSLHLPSLAQAIGARAMEAPLRAASAAERVRLVVAAGAAADPGLDAEQLATTCRRYAHASAAAAPLLGAVTFGGVTLALRHGGSASALRIAPHPGAALLAAADLAAGPVSAASAAAELLRCVDTLSGRLLAELPTMAVAAGATLAAAAAATAAVIVEGPATVGPTEGHAWREVRRKILLRIAACAAAVPVCDLLAKLEAVAELGPDVPPPGCHTSAAHAQACVATVSALEWRACTGLTLLLHTFLATGTIGQRPMLPAHAARARALATRMHDRLLAATVVRHLVRAPISEGGSGPAGGEPPTTALGSLTLRGGSAPPSSARPLISLFRVGDPTALLHLLTSTDHIANPAAPLVTLLAAREVTHLRATAAFGAVRLQAAGAVHPCALFLHGLGELAGLAGAKEGDGAAVVDAATRHLIAAIDAAGVAGEIRVLSGADGGSEGLPEVVGVEGFVALVHGLADHIAGGGAEAAEGEAAVGWRDAASFEVHHLLLLLPPSSDTLLPAPCRQCAAKLSTFCFSYLCRPLPHSHHALPFMKQPCLDGEEVNSNVECGTPSGERPPSKYKKPWH
jgi:hypothetical protein